MSIPHIIVIMNIILLLLNGMESAAVTKSVEKSSKFKIPLKLHSEDVEFFLSTIYNYAYWHSEKRQAYRHHGNLEVDICVIFYMHDNHNFLIDMELQEQVKEVPFAKRNISLFYLLQKKQQKEHPL